MAQDENGISILNEVGLFYAPSESDVFEPLDSIVGDVRGLAVLLLPVMSPLGHDPSAELRVFRIRFLRRTFTCILVVSIRNS